MSGRQPAESTLLIARGKAHRGVPGQVRPGHVEPLLSSLPRRDLRPDTTHLTA